MYTDQSVIDSIWVKGFTAGDKSRAFHKANPAENRIPNKADRPAVSSRVLLRSVPSRVVIILITLAATGKVI